MEAISILGSLLVFPDRLPLMPVLKPIPHEYGTVLCSDVKVLSFIQCVIFIIANFDVSNCRII